MMAATRSPRASLLRRTQNRAWSVAHPGGNKARAIIRCVDSGQLTAGRCVRRREPGSRAQGHAFPDSKSKGGADPNSMRFLAVICPLNALYSPAASSESMAKERILVPFNFRGGKIWSGAWGRHEAEGMSGYDYNG